MEQTAEPSYRSQRNRQPCGPFRFYGHSSVRHPAALSHTVSRLCALFSTDDKRQAAEPQRLRHACSPPSKPHRRTDCRRRKSAAAGGAPPPVPHRAVLSARRTRPLESHVPDRPSPWIASERTANDPVSGPKSGIRNIRPIGMSGWFRSEKSPKRPSSMEKPFRGSEPTACGTDRMQNLRANYLRYTFS